MDGSAIDLVKMFKNNIQKLNVPKKFLKLKSCPVCPTK